MMQAAIGAAGKGADMDAFCTFSWWWIFPMIFMILMAGGCIFMIMAMMRGHRGVMCAMPRRDAPPPG